MEITYLNILNWKHRQLVSIELQKHGIELFQSLPDCLEDYINGAKESVQTVWVESLVRALEGDNEVLQIQQDLELMLDEQVKLTGV